MLLTIAAVGPTLLAAWVLGDSTAYRRAYYRLLEDRLVVAERARDLEAKRAHAVDESAARLRRIERDLHDGAQIRLAALAMTLGELKENLEQADDSGMLRLAVAGHQNAKDTFAELRDLARGIHPPVLDPGLAFVLQDGVYQTCATAARVVEFLMGYYPILTGRRRAATRARRSRPGSAARTSTPEPVEEEIMANSARGGASNLNANIIEEFRANQGRVGGPLAGTPMILIHHIGVRSGIERVTPLACNPQGDGRLAIAQFGCWWTVGRTAKTTAHIGYVRASSMDSSHTK